MSQHLSLLKKSIEENQNTILTIFINPKQFGANEDLENYPRTLNEDLEKIDSISDKTIVFAPESTQEIYPEGFSTNITLGAKTKILCGLDRPEHFDGVTTVVYQLFKIINPEKAYFGEKDFQQLYLIRKMTRDLRLNVDIVGMPLIRDIDGLALSSRNIYLSKDERKQSLLLSQTLHEIKSFLEDSKLSQARELIESRKNDFQYLEIRDQNLNLYDNCQDQKSLRVFGSYKLGKTRLIDNIEVQL